MVGKIIAVQFHADILFAVEEPDGVFVALKPISDGLGLKWSGQHDRLQRDTILSEGIRVIRMPSPGGMQDATCLRMDLVNGWLFGIDDSRIKDPIVRERALTYKRECYRALHDHFFSKLALPQSDHDDRDEGDSLDLATPDGLKLRKINTAIRCFGERAGCQLWVKLGLEWVPAMAHVLSQVDMFDQGSPPGTVTVTVTPTTGAH